MSESPTPKPGFICIPDINGFTRFMNDVGMEISHATIPRVLEAIIGVGFPDFKLSEIMGDAVMFYHLGDFSLEKMATISQKIYDVFTKEIAEIAPELDANFAEKWAVSRLGLKIIIHHGEFVTADIAGRTKLMGEDVIVAMDLLKNDVEIREYLLLTDAVVQHYGEAAIDEMFTDDSVLSGTKEVRIFGECGYRYLQMIPGQVRGLRNKNQSGMG